MSNTTISYELPPLPAYELRPQQPLIAGIPDKIFSPILLIVVYWVVSGLWHLIDTYDLFPQYRLHTPAEVLKRNHVSRWDVFRDVIIQQVVQAAFGLGLGFFEPPDMVGKEQYDIAVWAQRIRIAERAVPAVLSFVGLNADGLAHKYASGSPILSGFLRGGEYPWAQSSLLIAGQELTVPAFTSWELLAAKGIYWIGIPFIQFMAAILIVDTWQYFWHRAMHMNKYMYTTFHIRHHRLYVPYAYGALYNHPFEGFLLDTLGAGLAYLVTGMTTRQGMCFFSGSTIKTIDDHCGYALPWDPLQLVTSNNAGYHDVHHQSWGIKTNFSQPFFTFWDSFMGTKWTGGDVSARYERTRLAAEKALDKNHSKPVTGSTTEESSKAPEKPYGSEIEDVRAEHSILQGEAIPSIPNGKAKKQAAGSRNQVLDSEEGPAVLREEVEEETEAQQVVRRSARKKSMPQAGIKSLKDRVNKNARGTVGGVLGLECSR